MATIRDFVNVEAYGTSEGADKGWDSRGRGRAKKNFEPPSSVVKRKVSLQDIRSELKNMRMSDMTKAERNIWNHLQNGQISKQEKASRIASELQGIDKVDMTRAESNISKHLGSSRHRDSDYANMETIPGHSSGGGEEWEKG